MARFGPQRHKKRKYEEPKKIRNILKVTDSMGQNHYCENNTLATREIPSV